MLQKGNLDRFIPPMVDLSSHEDLVFVPPEIAAKRYMKRLLSCCFDARAKSINKKSNLDRSDHISLAGIRPVPRRISSTPERCLDAPKFNGESYVKLLDWNRENVLVIALRDTVYAWNANDGVASRLISVSDGEYITSLAWMPDGKILAVGTDQGNIQLWDGTTLNLIRHIAGHTSRIGTLSWNTNTLASGSGDSFIHHRDIRTTSQNFSPMIGHTSEVGCISWCPGGNSLASGGEEGLLKIWDSRRNCCRLSLVHDASVNSLVWIENKRAIIASGSRLPDGSIRLWNTSSGDQIKRVNTRSEVCSLVWSSRGKELVSSNVTSGTGGISDSFSTWRYRSMTMTNKVEIGYRGKVFHLCQSPDETMIASVGTDETLRFWRMSNAIESKKVYEEPKYTTEMYIR